MLLQSQRDMDNCSIEESIFREKIERNTRFLAQLQLSSIDHGPEILDVTTALIADIASIDSMALKKCMEEKSVLLYTNVIRDCEVKALELERSLQGTKLSYNLFSDRVLSLEALLVSMRRQLHDMQSGLGICLYPRPIASEPLKPIETSCALNACPICSLWYSCRNFVSAECGHTYHSWCVAEHCKTSMKCAVNLCDVSFSIDWCASHGIRPVQVSGLQKVKEFHDTKILAKSSLSGIVTSSQTKELEGMRTVETREEIVSTLPRAIAVVSSTYVNGSSTASLTPPFTDDDLDKAVLSQSSFGTKRSRNGSASNEGTCSLVQLCQLCKKMPAEVILKDYGHDLFCTGCLDGKTACPVCDEAILGWKPLHRNVITNPFLASLGGECDAALDPVLPKPKQAKQTKLTKPQAVQVDAENSVVQEEDLLKKIPHCYDSDEEGQGLQVWCDGDEFCKGGARSKEFLDNNQSEGDCQQENGHEVDCHKESQSKSDDGSIHKQRAMSALIQDTNWSPAIAPNRGALSKRGRPKFMKLDRIVQDCPPMTMAPTMSGKKIMPPRGQKSVANHVHVEPSTRKRRASCDSFVPVKFRNM